MPAMTPSRPGVPVRTILATIGLVLATGLLILVVWATARVLTWIVVALFFAVALHPVVNWVQARARWLRRPVATLVVYLLVVLLLAGLAALFVVPLVREGAQLADRLPDLVSDARGGRGPIGPLLRRYHVEDFLRHHQDQIQAYVRGLGTPALALARSAATAVVAVITIFVLSYLMVLEAPKILDAAVTVVPTRHAGRIRRVGSACARTITGYLSGNLLISLICGLHTYVVLLVMGVPFAGLIALFVAVTALIPLVGATLGAIVATGAGFLHSIAAGIVIAVFFVVYQQVENHLLQPVIMARTVKLNPLTVLIAILLGVELAGLLGALLAVPVAGVAQVITRDLWDLQRHRPEQQPVAGDTADGPSSGKAAQNNESDVATSGVVDAGGG